MMRLAFKMYLNEGQKEEYKNGTTNCGLNYISY